jgi:thiol-disulfide isomerase/thioredoxin
MARILVAAIGFILLVAACAPSPTATPSTPSDVMPSATANPEPTGKPQISTHSRTVSDWRQSPLVDVRTGETFMLGDFAGRTVFVQMMGTLCAPCRTAQQTLREVRSQLAGEDYVFVSLDVETRAGSDALDQYVENEGFDWFFAVASLDMMAALTREFGRAVVDLPSTPYLVIYPDGTTSPLHTRLQTVEHLIEQDMNVGKGA